MIVLKKRQSRHLGMVQRRTKSLEKSLTSWKQRPITSLDGESQKLFHEESLYSVSTSKQKQYFHKYVLKTLMLREEFILLTCSKEWI